MKVFYCGIKHEKYDPSLGLSFEHENFYLSLREHPRVDEIGYFSYDDILKKGRKAWNRELLDAARVEKPDLIFFFMYTDELDEEVLIELKKLTKTVAWFADDHWRFHNYSRFWAPHFSWAVTTYSKAVDWYKGAGIEHIIRSQWAFNASTHSPVASSEGGEAYNASFVGSWSKPREKTLRALSERGIEVAAFGSGWERGRVSEDEMVNIFANSKINLALNDAPGFLNKNSLGRLLFRRSIDKVVLDPHPIRNAQTFAHRGIRQIKARHFMIPGCRGFTITAPADDIDRYYEAGKEMIFYNDIDDLEKRIVYYLSREEERRRIRDAGYQRTLSEHTYHGRFEEIFSKIDLSHE